MTAMDRHDEQKQEDQKQSMPDETSTNHAPHHDTMTTTHLQQVQQQDLPGEDKRYSSTSSPTSALPLQQQTKSSHPPVVQDESTQGPITYDGDNDCDNDNESNQHIHYTDEDIQRDAANIAVMGMVYISLLFFAGLFACAIAGSILLMGQFGLITSVIVLTLVAVVGGTIGWVLHTINTDRELNPQYRKMKRWQEIAKAVVVNEVINFQLDMQEHRLLTNGDTDVDDAHYYEEMGTDEHCDHDASAKASSGKSRSLVFGIVVKPFIKTKRRIKKMGRKNTKRENDAAAAGNEYVPPANTTGNSSAANEVV